MQCLWCELQVHTTPSLSDEAGDCSKGANTVVSQLHYFFANHGLGEKEVFLAADNCTGQLHAPVLGMACYGRATPGNHSVIHGCWPHQVRSRLVFRPFQEAVQEDESRQSNRDSRSGEQICTLQCSTAGHNRGWEDSCSNIRLDRLLCTTLKEGGWDQEAPSLQVYFQRA